MAEFEKTNNKGIGYKCDECGLTAKVVYVGRKNIFCKDHLPSDATILDEVAN